MPWARLWASRPPRSELVQLERERHHARGSSLPLRQGTNSRSLPYWLTAAELVTLVCAANRVASQLLARHLQAMLHHEESDGISTQSIIRRNGDGSVWNACAGCPWPGQQHRVAASHPQRRAELRQVTHPPGHRREHRHGRRARWPAAARTLPIERTLGFTARRNGTASAIDSWRDLCRPCSLDCLYTRDR